MFKGITNFFDRMVQRFLPDAFLFAVLLTFLVLAAGIIFTNNSPLEMVEHWGSGFWGLLEFAMQMSLIVVTGYILANTPVVKRLLKKISSLAKTPGQAIILVTIVALIACLINYGFGLVVGALLAIQVAKSVPKVDYRLLMASAYSGFLVWHGGLSGSIPLTVATEGHFLEEQMGVMPVTETLFSPANLFILLVICITLPILNWYLLKTRSPLDYTPAPSHIIEEEAEEEKKNENIKESRVTPAERLENSQVISLLIGILGMCFVVYHFVQNGFDLNLNIVNFTMLFLGILLHRTPRNFLNSTTDAVKNAGAIIIQFPFYAGIMGMMDSSGMSQAISEWFVGMATAETLPWFSFIAAGIMNFFIPSGGGQWAIQGPIMIPAAAALDADTAKTIMGVAWGDAWTNMIQPFWALPLLAIAGLKIKDIMGFCMIILLFSFIPISIGLLFF